MESGYSSVYEAAGRGAPVGVAAETIPHVAMALWASAAMGALFRWEYAPVPVRCEPVVRSGFRLALLWGVSEPAKVEFVAGDAEVFDDVSDNASRDVSGMPREGDQPFRPKGIGIMPVTTRSAEQFATNLTKSPLQLPAVVGRVLARGSSRENKPVTERGRYRASSFQQGFEMGFGGFLKPEQGLAPVPSVGMAAG